VYELYSQLLAGRAAHPADNFVITLIDIRRRTSFDAAA
jgi:hypothetical protein